MSKELYKRFRPKTLKGVLGQDVAIAALQKAVDEGKTPHALMLTGPSGTVKTTIGRILKNLLECGDADYTEINSGDFKGIDMARDIRRLINLSPISGKCRIWFIDEAHKLTNDAQNALLKMLEDTPDHAYFMLSTTDEQKLIRAIHTRCTQVKLVPLCQKDIERVIQRVVDKESLAVSADVVEEIASASDGSARKALVILEQVGSLPAEEQIKAIQTTTFNKAAAFELAKLLCVIPNPSWNDAATLLKQMKDEEAEGIRYCVLGYARKCMVGDVKAPNMKFAPRAFRIIDIFARNFYDSKHAGLAAACWEAIMMRPK